MDDLTSTALSYLQGGLSVIPVGKDKRPVISEWTSFQKQRPSPEEVKSWFSSNSRNIAVIGGKVSDDLEVMDFDFEAEAFKEWTQRVHEQDPGLLAKLILERSPHGVHIAYQCHETTVPGNSKLAKRGIEVSGGGEHSYKNKTFQAQEIGGKWFIVFEVIETRGEGGYCLIHPSKGYEIKQGDFRNVPAITASERDILIEAARECNTWLPSGDIQRGYSHRQNTNPGEQLPGADFDERGDIRALLGKHGWTNKGFGNDGREKWARPGKEKGKASSATLTDGKIFYCFSGNGYPFEAGRAYGPFAVYATLEHGGDFSAAAKALSAEGYGNRPENRQTGNPAGRSLGELKKKFSAEIRWIWRQHIAAGLPQKFSGREGDGKTSVCLVAAREILETHPDGTVVWLATEGAVLDTVSKMEKNGVTSPRFVVAEKSDGTYQFNFLKPPEIRELDTLLSRLPKPIIAVFIDSIRGMTSLGDSDSQIGHVMHQINAICCDKYGSALVYLDHHKKGQALDLRDKTVGTTAKSAAVRQDLAIVFKSNLTRKIVLAKSNLCATLPQLRSIEINGRITVEEDTEHADETQTNRAESFLVSLFANEKEHQTSDIYARGAKAGLSSDVLKKAKLNLPIKAYQERVGAPWFWRWTPESRNPALWEKSEESTKEKPNDISERDERDERDEPLKSSPPESARGTRETRGMRGITENDNPSGNNSKVTTDLQKNTSDYLEGVL